MPISLGPPPIQSAQGSQEWLDWFARLDDLLDAVPTTIDRPTLSADASYTSPNLQGGFVYKVLLSLVHSSSAAVTRLNFTDSSGTLQDSVGDTRQWGQSGGTAYNNASNPGIFIGTGSTTERVYAEFVILDVRESSIKTYMQGLSTDYAGGSTIRSNVLHGHRTVAEDNLNFNISASTGTMSGTIIVHRLPFQDE